MDIILASSSPYRTKQLKDFGLEFRTISPSVDEEALKARKTLPPRKMAQYLAYKKAMSLRGKHPHSVIIGADQLVNLKGQILGKPGNRENAIKMLEKMNGKTHELVTSLCVVAKKQSLTKTVIARIKMRRLKNREILAYVHRDQPLDCAGSYKFELSGFGLVQKIAVSDPSSLTGLPLIELSRLLLKLKIPLPFRDS